LSDARKAVLDACVDKLGVDWVMALREELKKEGREMRGGWPGTKAEARSRVISCIGPELARQKEPYPTAEEITRLAREVYAAARRAWLAEADASESE
jgi:hypothetical protein